MIVSVLLTAISLILAAIISLRTGVNSFLNQLITGIGIEEAEQENETLFLRIRTGGETGFCSIVTGPAVKRREGERERVRERREGEEGEEGE